MDAWKMLVPVIGVLVVLGWSGYNCYTGWTQGVVRVRFRIYREENGGFSFYAYLFACTAICFVAVPLGILSILTDRPRPDRSIGVEESRPPHGAAAAASPPGAVHTPPPSGAADTPPPRASSTSSPSGSSSTHPPQAADGGEEHPGPPRKVRKEFSLISLLAGIAWYACYRGWRYAFLRLMERPWKPGPDKALFHAGMILLTCLCVILTIGVFVL